MMKISHREDQSKDDFSAVFTTSDTTGGEAEKLFARHECDELISFVEHRLRCGEGWLKEWSLVGPHMRTAQSGSANDHTLPSFLTLEDVLSVSNLDGVSRSNSFSLAKSSGAESAPPTSESANPGVGSDEATLVRNAEGTHGDGQRVDAANFPPPSMYDGPCLGVVAKPIGNSVGGGKIYPEVGGPCYGIDAVPIQLPGVGANLPLPPMFDGPCLGVVGEPIGNSAGDGKIYPEVGGPCYGIDAVPIQVPGVGANLPLPPMFDGPCLGLVGEPIGNSAGDGKIYPEVGGPCYGIDAVSIRVPGDGASITPLISVSHSIPDFDSPCYGLPDIQKAITPDDIGIDLQIPSVANQARSIPFDTPCLGINEVRLVGNAGQTLDLSIPAAAMLDQQYQVNTVL